MLCVINGENGNQKGGKIINSVIDSIVHRESQHLFSWTGRSSPGMKPKVAFSEYKELIGLIHAVCRRADETYSRKDCERDLTYKVFKYAKTKRSLNSDVKLSLEPELNIDSNSSDNPSKQEKLLENFSQFLKMMKDT